MPLTNSEAKKQYVPSHEADKNAAEHRKTDCVHHAACKAKEIVSPSGV